MSVQTEPWSCTLGELQAQLQKEGLTWTQFAGDVQLLAKNLFSQVIRMHQRHKVPHLALNLDNIVVRWDGE